MGILEKSKKSMKVKALIFKVQGKNKKIKKPLIAGLLRKRYLRSDEKHFLFIRYFRYPSGNISYRNDMVEYIRRLVLRDIKPEDLRVMTHKRKFAGHFENDDQFGFYMPSPTSNHWN